jgi:hypothetical protein
MPIAQVKDQGIVAGGISVRLGPAGHSGSPVEVGGLRPLGSGGTTLCDGRPPDPEFGGRLVKTTGDGILATFDGPGRAIRSAATLAHELAGIGLQLRAGLHIGEVELRDRHRRDRGPHRRTGAGHRQPGEILATGPCPTSWWDPTLLWMITGLTPLKGVKGTWQLFAVVAH